MATATSETASSPILTDGQVVGVAIGIGIVAVIIVLLPLLLSKSYSKGVAGLPPAQGTQRRASFFEIPYITWFVVHYGVAALAILAIVLLGVDNVIDKGTVSALLGSLFGYVLGSASHSSQEPGSQPPTKPGPEQTPAGSPPAATIQAATSDAPVAVDAGDQGTATSSAPASTAE